MTQNENEIEKAIPSGDFAQDLGSAVPPSETQEDTEVSGDQASGKTEMGQVGGQVVDESDAILEDLGNAVDWQREFSERVLAASARIRAILAEYQIDIVAQTNINEVKIEIPISFKDLKHNSPAQPELLSDK